MGLARSSYYYRPEAPGEEDLAAQANLRDRIEAICAEFPRYGYRRVTAQLKREGRIVNHKRVARIMREEALTVRSLKCFTVTTDSRHGLPVFSNRLSETTLSGPDQAWQADITYIRIVTGSVFCGDPGCLEPASCRLRALEADRHPADALCPASRHCQSSTTARLHPSL